MHQSISIEKNGCKERCQDYDDIATKLCICDL
jgi:hypothetical protein